MSTHHSHHGLLVWKYLWLQRWPQWRLTSWTEAPSARCSQPVPRGVLAEPSGLPAAGASITFLSWGQVCVELHSRQKHLPWRLHSTGPPSPLGFLKRKHGHCSTELSLILHWVRSFAQGREIKIVCTHRPWLWRKQSSRTVLLDLTVQSSGWGGKQAVWRMSWMMRSLVMGWTNKLRNNNRHYLGSYLILKQRQVLGSLILRHFMDIFACVSSLIPQDWGCWHMALSTGETVSQWFTSQSGPGLL